ncbi:hypothetical protein KDD17_08915 [Sulfitobacter albidus]|uniref:Uncharacterized protein n=1 Tax=Sulfitobacter albidus TaxID=2829501 RepID=A0A975JBN0_9RHOB|nr:hypothetical protein [Sulfitobacter albidus]QUJ75150.1 hypothetical protein KDD17_08915 [Sulfitobacter albidus]
MSGQNSIEVLLGCDPQARVTITETDTGTLFIVVANADPAGKPLDFDGVFFNLADGSSLDALNFFPSANEGSIFSPVTGIQAAINGVDTLANGAQVADQFDIGIQFGTSDDTTSGEVAQANFTLFGDNGPLSIDDLDISSFTAVIDSDGGNGQVLTTGDTPDADPIQISKEALFDNFNDIHTPTDSDIVDSNDGWVAAYDKLVTNASNEGTLTFSEVATDGPVTLTMDLTTHNTHVFENSGHYADTLRVEVSLDGGDWVLLDEYRVNDHGTALVGSETGQSFTASGATVSYSGGILDTASETAQFRVISDVTANDEVLKIDNVSVTVSEEVPGEATQTKVLAAEDFNAIHDPSQSDIIGRDDGWDVVNGELRTDGHNDGILKFQPVEANGDISFSFDATVADASKFEATGDYRDSLTLQFRTEDGSWQTLDRFVVNDEGTALVGNNTGNEITEDGASLTYSGGALDDLSGDVHFRVISKITAGDEIVTFDNVEITETSAGAGTGGDAVTIDFEGLNSGDVVSDQFDGVTISGQREHDTDNVNDAMIFDTDNPTGGDHDLAFNGVGNALIISEDNDGSDADDNAGGGTLTFNFEAPSEVLSINILDVEEQGGTIDLFDVDGNLIDTLGIPASGDNSQQELIINAQNVSIMDVNLVGSGAVDDLTFIPPADDDAKGGQYDVEYVAGLPILAPVEDDQTKDEDPDDQDVFNFVTA